MHPSLASSSSRRRVACIVAVAIVVGVGSAAHAQNGAAQLAGIVVDGNRLAKEGESGLVLLTRDGARQDAHAGTTLQPGDRIETGPSSYAVIRYSSGSEVLMAPNSGGRVGSLADFAGKAFVKVRGMFELETTFVKVTSRGTSYLVRTAADGGTLVAVFEGVVDVGSMSGAWPSVTIGAGKTAFAHPDAPHLLWNVFMVDEFAQTRDWVRRVERLVPAPPDVSTGALDGSVAMTAAIAAIRSQMAGVIAWCANARMASFPWPSPPQPTVTAVIPPYLLFPSAAKGRTLADVADRLEGAIARAEYRQPKYLGVGCNGFAIVLDLEHITEDGTRMRGALGFAPPSQEEEFSLAAYIKRLFYAPPGQYRQIVLLVSSQRMKNSTAGPTAAELRAITSDGVSTLPGGFADVPYTSDHVVQALIYEFEKGPRDGDEATLIPPEGRLGATVHLQKAHLF